MGVLTYFGLVCLLSGRTSVLVTEITLSGNAVA